MGEQPMTGALYHLMINVKNVLEVLKNDLTEKTETPVSEHIKRDPIELASALEKRQVFSKTLEKIVFALGEAEILSTLARYVELLELEKYRYLLQIRRLYDENNWLKGENGLYNDHFKSLQDKITEMEGQKQHYKFIHQQRRFDAEEKPLFSEGSMLDDPTWANIDDQDMEDYDKVVPSQLRTVYKLVLESLQRSNYNLPHKLLNQLLDRNQANGMSMTIENAYLHDMKALVYRRQKRLNETNRHLQQAKVIRQQVFGPDSLQVATTLNNISICNSKLGNFNEAEVACREALVIRQKVFGEDHPNTVKQLHNLGLICTFLKNYDEALKLFDLAISIQQTSDLFDTTSILRTKNSIAMCYLRNNNVEKAEKVLTEVIDQYHEKVKGRLPNQNFDPNISMIVSAYEMKPRRALEVLVDEYGIIRHDDILYVIAKNLFNLYGKQTKARQQKIIADWLNNKHVKRLRKDDTRLRDNTFTRDDTMDQSERGGAKKLGYFSKSTSQISEFSRALSHTTTDTRSEPDTSPDAPSGSGSKRMQFAKRLFPFKKKK